VLLGSSRMCPPTQSVVFAGTFQSGLSPLQGICSPQCTNLLWKSWRFLRLRLWFSVSFCVSPPTCLVIFFSFWSRVVLNCLGHFFITTCQVLKPTYLAGCTRHLRTCERFMVLGAGLGVFVGPSSFSSTKSGSFASSWLVLLVMESLVSEPGVQCISHFVEIAHLILDSQPLSCNLICLVWDNALSETLVVGPNTVVAWIPP
jgi:hypothetical protein